RLAQGEGGQAGGEEGQEGEGRGEGRGRGRRRTGRWCRSRRRRPWGEGPRRESPGRRRRQGPGRQGTRRQGKEITTQARRDKPAGSPVARNIKKTGPCRPVFLFPLAARKVFCMGARSASVGSETGSWESIRPRGAELRNPRWRFGLGAY